MQIGDLIKWKDSYSQGAEWKDMIGLIVSDEWFEMGVYATLKIAWQDGRAYEVRTQDIEVIKGANNGNAK